MWARPSRSPVRCHRFGRGFSKSTPTEAGNVLAIERENASADKLADSDTGGLQARHFLAGPCGKDFLNIGVSFHLQLPSCRHQPGKIADEVRTEFGIIPGFPGYECFSCRLCSRWLAFVSCARCGISLINQRRYGIGAWRSPVSALVWETRGRRFKSSRSDQRRPSIAGSFCIFGRQSPKEQKPNKTT